MIITRTVCDSCKNDVPEEMPSWRLHGNVKDFSTYMEVCHLCVINKLGIKEMKE